MKFLSTIALLYLTSLVASTPASAPLTDISVRDSLPLESYHVLEKRKGGGGGKGGGGKTGGSSGGSSGVSGGRTYSFSPLSNVGGRTRDGSGTPKAYGNRYTGGAVVPYTAGGRSPTRGITPFLFPVAGLAFFPGLWLYGSVWAYPYGYPYHWIENGRNRTSNVTCLCQQYQVCGCDPDNNSTFLTQVLTNGSTAAIAPVNTTMVQTVDFGNGTVASFINGSLENGTTADGGTEPSDDSQISASVRVAMEMSGYWVMIATVVWGIWLAN